MALSAGEVHDEERRLVVRRDAVGGAAAGEQAALRGADGRRGGAEPGSAAAGRGGLPAPAAAPGPHAQGRRRPPERVLEETRGRAALLPRDTPVPAEEDLGLHSGHVTPAVTVTN